MNLNEILQKGIVFKYNGTFLERDFTSGLKNVLPSNSTLLLQWRRIFSKQFEQYCGVDFILHSWMNKNSNRQRLHGHICHELMIGQRSPSFREAMSEFSNHTNYLWRNFHLAYQFGIAIRKKRIHQTVFIHKFLSVVFLIGIQQSLMQKRYLLPIHGFLFRQTGKK